VGAGPNVRLKLSSRAENVLLLRQTLSGLAESMGLDPIALNDITTAVTEAANNVVLHAYGGEEGPLEVEFASGPASLTVVVGDRGRGIARALRSGETVSDGIGLPVIHALSETVEFRERPSGGTEVAMRFQPLQIRQPDGAALDDGAADLGALEVDGGITLAVAPTELARSVVPRVIATLAARAHLTTDRIADAQLLADTVLADLDRAGAGQLLVAIHVEQRALELRIGPLAGGLLDGSGRALPGSVLSHLADGQDVLAAGELQLLELRILQR